MTQHPHPVAAALLLWAALASAGAAPPRAEPDQPEASVVWQKLRAGLFGGRPLQAAPESLLSIDAPVRAEDAAIVPIAVRTRLAPGDPRHVTKLTLVIDNNPAPVAAVFEFFRAAGSADIETRVRVDEYTHVRAIAELSDGELLMAVRYVKASGGCSAPPAKDAQAALAQLGRMRLRVDGDVKLGRPALAQVMVSHPNHSGLAMDQLTRQYTPAHFVRQLSVSYAGEPVFAADLDFAISENPNVRFHFVPRGPGTLKAEVVDSQERRFESALELQPTS